MSRRWLGRRTEKRRPFHTEGRTLNRHSVGKEPEMFLWNQNQFEVIRASSAELKRGERRGWRGCQGTAVVVGLFMLHCLGDIPLKTLKQEGCDHMAF